MKIHYLFPNRFKKIGWTIFIPGLIIGIFYLISGSEPAWLNLKVFALVDHDILPGNFFTISKTNIIDEIILLLLIIGALLVAFSKEKKEDEYIAKIRLESLVWATYVNYAILIIVILFVFDFAFLWVMIFNMFTILIFFLIRFNWILYKSKKSVKYEE